ncbi:helix-turn-helix domain-containing protein [Sphingobacterium faecale]|uniref:XRE family transcriptional regulator n=1 Tax=Sphingobacterium faecale TaxID=2803775 RepID=A0ABS1QZY9_9SPHI|nr:XRE family transcriptional regulator [Sphingobacterium faecale]MBL1407216.1 XRE family transcriptional regulator [Sphingobacterium faecale]
MEDLLKSNPLYRIEYELIKNVKAIRTIKGLSQEKLSNNMGLFKTFVSNCESLGEDQKYNIRHLGLLKKALNLDSLDELFPNGIPADEQIIIRYKKVPKKKADGTDSKLFETVVVDIILAEEETKAASNKRKKYKND